MQKSDLKQISNLLDQKLDKKLDQRFKKNKEDMNAMEARIMTSTQKEFNVMDQRLDGITLELKKKINKSDLEDWEFNNKIKSDIKVLKYVNIDKLKNLPAASKIKDTLIKEGLE